MMLAALTFVAGLWLFTGDYGRSYPYIFILPWMLALAAIVAAPAVYYFLHGGLPLHNPIIFAAWSYFFPSFVVGGFAVAFGLSQPYFLSFVQDSANDLPFTILLAGLGYAALASGFMLSPGRRIGRSVSRYLPDREYTLNSLIVPGLILLFSGLINSAFAFVMGVIGYQKVAEIGQFDGIIFLTTLFWMQGSFLLWYILFKRGSVDPVAVLIAAALLSTSLGRALFAGNRGSLLQLFVIVSFAFLLAGGRVTFKRTVAGGLVLGFCLMAGMLYGTTFRDIKGSQEQVGLDTYTESIFDTFDRVGHSDNSSNLAFAFANLSERLDGVSSLAVVASNYEALAPYEESYGLNNNIWNDITTFFIPRVIWPNKPVASDPRAYSDLYFNYADNSFTITPIGDLLRNYGVIGVAIGMFILGLLLRIVYGALIEGQPVVSWRATLYFMLIINLSYEGFYGTIVPYMFKVGATTLVGILFVNFFARRIDVWPGLSTLPPRK
jgi:hypothetical protein